MTCPICAKETEPKFRPFCSKTCADIDLGRWFNGTYTMPSDDLEDVDPIETAGDEDETPRH